MSKFPTLDTPTPEQLAVLGLALVPVQPRGKKALVPWRDIEAAPTPGEVSEWRKEFPDCNWAVKLGPPSRGVVAVDIDSYEAQAWCDYDPEKWDFDPNKRDETGRRGLHDPIGPWYTTGRGSVRLFTYDGEAPRGVVKPYPGVEVKLCRALQNLPPSIHPNGRPYIWRMPPAVDGHTVYKRCGDIKMEAAVWSPPPLPNWLRRLAGLEGGNEAPEPEPFPLSGIRAQLHSWASDHRLVDYLLHMAGRQLTELDKGIRCPLPGHVDVRPSANFHRTRDSRIMLTCWSHPGVDGLLHLTLGEVYRALLTGRTRKLSRTERGQALTELAMAAGLGAGELLDETDRRLREVSRVVETLWAEEETTDVYMLCPGALREPARSIWKYISGHFRSEAAVGVVEARLSLRFVSTNTGVPLKTTWHVLRELTAAGLIVRHASPAGYRHWGDRYSLPSHVELEAVRQKVTALASQDQRKGGDQDAKISVGHNARRS